MGGDDVKLLYHFGTGLTTVCLQSIFHCQQMVLFFKKGNFQTSFFSVQSDAQAGIFPANPRTLFVGNLKEYALNF